MTNAANSVTLLQSILTTLTTLESGALTVGVKEIDDETRRLVSTARSGLCQIIWDYGSRAQQNTTQAQRQIAAGGAESSIAAEYKVLDDYISDLNKQITVLNNPTSVPRRVQNPLR